jgi:formimidoylglutamate deiminase
MPEARPRSLWAPRAWLPAAPSSAGQRDGGWQADVLLQIGSDGRWAAITPGVAQAPAGAQVLAGPLLPGLVNSHSHAFQRAFAGLAERRETETDDFWSWRERMYRVALRITADQLQAIAAQLYLELLRGGYTQVCEFHYLQHQPDGRPYADPLALGWALADAAAEAGVGLTLMPALYERAGFDQPALRDDQRRFATTADGVWAAAQRISASGRPLLQAGLVLHSLRAAAPDSVHRLRRLAEGFAGPIHIHVAEQTNEVDDCLAATGQRPIAWLAQQGLLDQRWQLVHATHTVPAEISAVAHSGAGVVICPSTEANLGDGLCDLPGWLAAQVPIAIGSDSHVGRCWREELRWLDYGQRLVQKRRNVGAAPAQGQPATAHRLFSRALQAGAAACGESRWGLVVGARADALLADVDDPATLGIPAERWLDAQVFSSPVRPWQAVMVAGRWVILDHQHPRQATIARQFEAAMGSLAAPSDLAGQAGASGHR